MDYPRLTGLPQRLPFFALISAIAVTWTGNMAALVAVPWFVLEITGNAAKTGLTGAALGVGTVAGGVFGGPVVDRLGFKKTSVTSQRSPEALIHPTS